MSSQFVDFNSLEENVVFTVQTMQRFYGSTGYFYIIRITKPDNSINFIMNIREGIMENSIYEKLEEIRQGTQKKRFTFTKKTSTSFINCECTIHSCKWC